jgi:NAD(P)H-hydrate epimerase
VLAVDIASGIDGLTGEARGRPVRANQTVTFAALKPGLLLADGIDACGAIEVVDIGLDVSQARAHLVETHDVARLLPGRDTHTHKWRAAVWVIGGSTGMTGAARLACGGAMRAGAGYVRLSVPGAHDAGAPTEVVQVPVSEALDDIDPADAARFAALVVGPGLGRAPSMADALAGFVARCDRPLVLDGDALTLLGERAEGVLAGRAAPTVLTPHDRELRELAGAEPGADRFAAVRALAARTGGVVLLKGATTVVADASGEVLVSTTGDARLATAGTGDVLAGCIGALLARGMRPLDAAAAGAHLHGLAARRSPREGMVAGDLLVHLPVVLSELRGR